MPSAWQGWVALALFVALVVVAAVLLPPSRHLPAFLLSVLALAAMLVTVCWWKGEPPRWR